jgi:hypothetical protein
MNESSTPPMLIPDRVCIRSELAAMRADFHALLDTLSDADWRRRDPISAFSVGELAAVLAALESVQDHEWQQSAAFYDEEFWTVEHTFCTAARPLCRTR